MSQTPALSDARDRRTRWAWIAGLLLLTAAYRVAAASTEGLWNTAPLMAASFGGGLLLGWRFFWVPALLLLASDLFLGLSQGTGPGAYTWAGGAVYTLAALAGAWTGSGPLGRRWLVLLGGTLCSSVAFYAAANSYAWLASPEYAKTWAGWWQSQTTGLPQYHPPAWAFLVRALLADTVWCALASPLFFQSAARAKSPAPQAGASAC